MSVCLSVTSESPTIISKHRITQTVPAIAWGLYVSEAKRLSEITMGHSNGGAKYKWVGYYMQYKDLFDKTDNQLIVDFIKDINFYHRL